MAYCIMCEQMTELTVGFHIRPKGNLWEGYICFGPFTYSAPPEPPEDWELWAVEPDVDELEQMDRVAESLLLGLQ